MRADPSFSPPPVDPQSDPDRVTLVLRYELLTPLFGGGVVPDEADPITTVRASEVRGHLRFWWRATRGGQYATLAELKEAEAALWGAASTEEKAYPSKVQVVVQCDQPGTIDRPFEVIKNPKNGRPKLIPRPGSIVPAYAAFPLQPPIKEQQVDMKIKPVRVGVAFTLTLTYPQDAEKDMEATLWAWETFGGIGARTRRGFGAVHRVTIDGAPVQLPKTYAEVCQRLEENLQTWGVAGKGVDGVPYISTNLALLRVINRENKNSLEVWQSLIADLKEFRQYRNDKGGGKPGRSYWPEADEIRRLTKKNAKKHPPQNPVHKFPRAVYGLPIVFHFKDAKIGDPSDTILQMANHDRLASPLLIRPLRLQKGAVGVALVLQSNPRFPEPLVLQGAPGTPAVEWQLTLEESKKLGDTVSDETDVLEAVLDYLALQET